MRHAAPVTIAVGLAAVLALIVANGWFVAAEFAFVAARRTRLEELAEDGDRRARRALGLMRRLSFMLSGAQLGITVTSLVVGLIAAPVFTRALAPVARLAGLSDAVSTSVAVAVGFVLSTTAQMVVGELAPKNLAIARPEPLARALASSQAVYLRLGGPLIRLFDGAANGLLRLLGIEPAEEIDERVSPEELERIIATSGAEGTLPHELAALLRRALDFGSLRAADAMVPRPHVVAIDAGATCADLQRLAVETGHSRFPAIGSDLDDVVGIAQVKDVLGIPPAQRPLTPVRAILEPDVAVPESARLGDVLADLRQSHVQLAVVVDEYGGIAGIVTLEDIVEELVGEIEDEFDLRVPAVRPLSGGRFRVPGGWRIDEVVRDTAVPLPHGDYDTIAGLLMTELGRVPAEGDEVVVDGARLVVLAVEGHAVTQVEIVPLGDGGGSRAGVAGEDPR